MSNDKRIHGFPGVWDCVTPKWGERKTKRRKERREEWRKKGDQDKPLGNHWCKRQRALTFGLKDLGFIRKIKSIL